MKKKKFNIPTEVSLEVTDVRICDPETLETLETLIGPIPVAKITETKPKKENIFDSFIGRIKNGRISKK